MALSPFLVVLWEGTMEVPGLRGGGRRLAGGAG